MGLIDIPDEEIAKVTMRIVAVKNNIIYIEKRFYLLLGREKVGKNI